VIAVRRTPPLFASILTGCSGEGESFAETGDNGRVQTEVCGKTKGGRIVDSEARRGGDANGEVWRHRRPGRGASLFLGDRGEGTR
jgi:hypothetical protein